MHQDVWGLVVEFMLPIDVLASLLTVDRNIYQLIGRCFVSFDEIMKFYNNFKCNFRISFIFESNKSKNNENRILLIGNVKYFMRFYLLELSYECCLKKELEKSKTNLLKFLDNSKFTLLNFYRSILYENSNFPNLECTESLNFVKVGMPIFGPLRLGSIIRFRDYRNIYDGPVQYYHGHLEFIQKNEFSDNLSDHTECISSINIITCFSMGHHSFDELDEWFSYLRDNKNLQNLGIIVNLNPIWNGKPVIDREAVKKALQFEKSIFVEGDMKVEYCYVPFWFALFQSAYFPKSKNGYYIKEVINKQNTSILSNCGLM